LRTIADERRARQKSERINALVAELAREESKMTNVAVPATPDDAIGVRLQDFYAYLPAHSYLFVPTREKWPAINVHAGIAPVDVGREKPIPASAYLDANRPVEQMTWAPGEPLEIRDRLIADGGWIKRRGVTTLNTYRPPTIRPRAGDALTWVRHVEYVYPDE